jgi:hypothetical protein
MVAGPVFVSRTTRALRRCVENFPPQGFATHCSSMEILNTVLKLVNVVVSLACRDFDFAYHCFCWRHWLISLLLLLLGNDSLQSQILWTST